MTSKQAQKPGDRIRIGEAARILGVHPQTVRDYESRELIGSIRTAGGERRFLRGDVEHLRDNPPELYKRKPPRRAAAETPDSAALAGAGAQS